MPIFAHQTTINTNPTPVFSLASPADGDILTWNATTQSFTNSPTLPSAVTTTASNKGSGEGVFKQKTGVDLEFKSLVAGSNVTLTADADTITVATTAASNVTAGQNLGGGQGPFSQISGTTMQFKEILANSPLSIVAGANDLTISSSAEANTNTAMGTAGDGESLVGTKLLSDLPIKRIKGGKNLTATSETNGVALSLTASDGLTGTGHQGKLLYSDTNGDLQVLSTAGSYNYSTAISGTTTHYRVLQTTGADGVLQWSEAAGAQIYQFRIDFSGTGGFASASGMATGWSYTNTGNKCTITHPMGVMPKMISYFGHKTGDNSFHYRVPTGAYELTVKRGDIQNKFDFTVTAGIAGSENNGYALVQVMF